MATSAGAGFCLLLRWRGFTAVLLLHFLKLPAVMISQPSVAPAGINKEC